MKKFCIICIICCLFSGTAYAQNVYYKSYTDSTSGRTVEYFDLDGDNVERCYFTQSYWLKDSDAFVVSSVSKSKLYKYDVKKHTAEALHDGNIKCNDIGITNDNIMYMRPIGERMLYRIDLDGETTTEEIYAEVNADGTGIEGALTMSIWNGNYDRDIGFSGTDGRYPIGNKHYMYNREHPDGASAGWKQWKNAFHFLVPDEFLVDTDYEKVEIEVECYIPSGQIQLEFNGKSLTNYVTANKWVTTTFEIKSSDGYAFNNGISGCDFRIFAKDCQGYLHKVTVRKYGVYNIECLGDRPSGYLVHTTNDGKFVSLNTDHGAEHTFEIYDVEKGTWSGKLYEGEFVGPGRNTDHVMINPVYSNLILFVHDGTTRAGWDIDLDRIWLYDTETGIYKNLYKQRKNIENVSTGEKIGHENWTADGESIVAVKYDEPKNIGKNGIIRMNKYGEECEYLNDDYDYWHCHPSPDGRWIVADTKLVDSKTKIVLIDSKTGKSYVVANPRTGWEDPWQPHAQFSRDGQKVTFSMIYRQKNGSDVLGVGIVDVSDLVNDGQYVDDIYKKTNEKNGILISPFEINFGGASSNEITTYMEDIDGKEKDISLYTAVYGDRGQLISLNESKSNSASDGKITGNFDWTDDSSMLKCFLWNNNDSSPFITYPNPVEKLRIAKTGMNYVVLTWQPSNNMIDSSYEIYRNGEKIGETSDLVYRDTNLTKGTEYIYEVRPIYTGNYYVGDNDSCITITPTYSNGRWTMPAQMNTLSGPKASVKVTTNSTTSVSEPSSTYQYVKWDASGPTGMSEPFGGKVMSDNSRYLRNTTSLWMTLKVDDSYQVGSHMNMAWIDITYQDIGTSEIYLEYNTSDPTATSSTKSHKRAEEVICCKNSGGIITKRISLIDVDFSGYNGYDFRIGTNGYAYISGVRVLGY